MQIHAEDKSPSCFVYSKNLNSALQSLTYMGIGEAHVGESYLYMADLWL